MRFDNLQPFKIPNINGGNFFGVGHRTMNALFLFPRAENCPDARGLHCGLYSDDQKQPQS